MIGKSLQLIVVVTIFAFVSALAANAQTKVPGKYVYLYENTTDEGGVALILSEKGVAVWKNIEDGEERRYERKGIWKLSEDQKSLTVSFQKDSARNDFQSDPFELGFSISDAGLIVKSSALPGIKANEAVFKRQ